MPAAPRFLDLARPRPAAPAAPRRQAAVPSVLPGGGTDGPAIRAAAEQVQHDRGWVAVAVDRIATRISRLPPQVVAVGADDPPESQRVRPAQDPARAAHVRRFYAGVVGEDAEPIPNHPLARLLHRPNGVQGWREFSLELVTIWELTGRFDLEVTESADRNLPAELTVLRSQWLKAERAKDGTLERWLYRPDGDHSRERSIRPENLLTHMDPHPNSTTRARSRLECGAAWVDGAEAIDLTRRGHFKNGPNPSALVELNDDRYVEPEVGVLDELRERVRSRLGGVEKAGEVFVQPPGMAVKPWGLAPKEMVYKESGDAMRDNVLALFGVPPVIAGVTSTYNRATSEAAERVFCDHTVNPKAALLACVLTHRLARRFPGDGLSSGLSGVAVIFPDAAPGDTEERRKDQELALRFGGMTPDELRAEQGREVKDEPAYRTGYMPAGLAPLSAEAREEVAPDPADEPDPGDDEEDPDDPGGEDGGDGKGDGDDDE